MPYVPDNSDDGDKGLGMIIHLLEEPYHDFWFHLGKFVHAISEVEAELIFLLRDISKLSAPKFGALFSGIRSEGARNDINNLLEATNQTKKKDRLKRTFGQIAEIGTTRNNLVHWGATTDSLGAFTVSNAKRRPLKPREYNISIIDFKNMCQDLTVIKFLLQCERSDSGRDDDRLYAQLSQRAWRYKPPQPNPPTNKKGQGRPKSRPRPDASKKSQ